MADLSALTPMKPTPAVVEIEGETINLVFDAYKVTQAWLELRMAEALAGAILEWDVTADGNPLEPTQENLDQLPFPVLGEIVKAVLDASGPSSAEGNGSSESVSEPLSATSGPDSTSSPNGLETSMSPVNSASLSPA